MDHTQFLDMCNAWGIYVLLPFMMTKVNYPDLKELDARRGILIDVKAFIERYSALSQT